MSEHIHLDEYEAFQRLEDALNKAQEAAGWIAYHRKSVHWAAVSKGLLQIRDKCFDLGMKQTTNRKH